MPIILLGTLLQAWASSKSLAPIASGGDNDPSDPPSGSGAGTKAPKDIRKDFKGQKIGNETHRSTTDPEAMLYRKADAAPMKPCYPVARFHRQRQNARHGGLP